MPAKTKAKKNPPKPTAELALGRSIAWLGTAIFQGERLIKLDAFVGTFHHDWRTWTDEQTRAFREATELPGGHPVDDAEGNLFVYALSQAARWLVYARAFDEKLAKAVGAFDKAVPHARDIRDMIEHEDEYLTGGGNKKDKYAMPYMGLPSNAHTTISHGGAHLIGGGRIDVQKATDALRKVLLVAEGTRMRLAPPKPPTFGLRVNAV